MLDNTFNLFGMNTLNNFTKGNIASNYTVREEQGFPIQGAIGSILSLPKQSIDDVQDGLIINRLYKTNSSNNQINKFSPSHKNYVNPTIEQPSTPLLYCNSNHQSDLLPFYPNGQPNLNLNPSCDNLTINGTGSPTLYGTSTFGLNDIDLINNPNNSIGHELQYQGNANNLGSRSLGEGRHSCKELLPGYNVPNLKINNVSTETGYISEPVSFNHSIPLYQVGDWTKEGDNFLKEFNTQKYCK